MGMSIQLLTTDSNDRSFNKQHLIYLFCSLIRYVWTRLKFSFKQQTVNPSWNGAIFFSNSATRYGGILAGTAVWLVTVTLGASTRTHFTLVPHACDVSTVERIKLITKNICIPCDLLKPSCWIVFFEFFKSPWNEVHLWPLTIVWYNPPLSCRSHRWLCTRHWKVGLYISYLDHSATSLL